MSDTLSIKDFVSAMLADICSSVDNAREQFPQIAPKDSTSSVNKDLATLVEFDLAVSIAETKSNASDSHKGFKIGIMKFEAGIDKTDLDNTEKAVSTVSRVKFSVPVYFQYSQEKAVKESHQSREIIRVNTRKGY
jgi:hypothetical protein